MKVSPNGITSWTVLTHTANDDCMVVRMPLEETFPPNDNHPKFARPRRVSLLRRVRVASHVPIQSDGFTSRWTTTIHSLHVPARGRRLRARRTTRLPAGRADASMRAVRPRRCGPAPPPASARTERASSGLHCDDETELGRLKIAFEDRTGLLGTLRLLPPTDADARPTPPRAPSSRPPAAASSPAPSLGCPAPGR